MTRAVDDWPDAYCQPYEERASLTTALLVTICTDEVRQPISKPRKGRNHLRCASACIETSRHLPHHPQSHHHCCGHFRAWPEVRRPKLEALGTGTVASINITTMQPALVPLSRSTNVLSSSPLASAFHSTRNGIRKMISSESVTLTQASPGTHLR